MHVTHWFPDYSLVVKANTADERFATSKTNESKSEWAQGWVLENRRDLKQPLKNLVF
jgi:hypothetical protein